MNDWAAPLIAAALFAFLSPGLVLQIPGKNQPIDFMNMKTSVAAIFVHAVLYALFLILFVFTVCFPFVKINAMLLLWLWPRLDSAHAQRAFGFVVNLGRWSMLDVFVVAILVLTVKSSGVANIRVADGFFLFFLSVMLTQFASLWTGKVVARLAE